MQGKAKNPLQQSKEGTATGLQEWEERPKKYEQTAEKAQRKQRSTRTEERPENQDKEKQSRP
jgi:hypothetical protein